MEERMAELEKKVEATEILIGEIGANLILMDADFKLCRTRVFEQMDGLEETLKANTETSQKTCDAVTGMEDTWDALQGFTKVCKWIVRIVKWLSIIGGFIWSVLYILVNGHVPTPPGN